MIGEQRTRFWSDTKLTLRIGAYLLAVLGAVLTCAFAWRLWEEGYTSPGEQFVGMLRDCTPVVLSIVWLLPLTAWIAIRHSHRVFGPVVRFRHTCQEVSRGELVRPIKLRKGDYLVNLQDDMNQMLDALQRRGVAILKPADPACDDAKLRTPA